MHTEITKTRDGTTIFWGKKDSGDPNSDDLWLWVTIGTPRKDAANYRRVPDELEDHLDETLKWDRKKWEKHLKKVLSKTPKTTILGWEKTQQKPKKP